MLSRLVEANPVKVNSLYTVGFLMMGLELEVLIMDIPAGNTISRVSRTKKLLFPDQGSNIGTDLTALLETVLIGRKLMEDVEAFISCSRKRKAVELDASQKSTSKYEDLGLFGKDIFTKYFELHAKDREQFSATEMLTLSSLLQCFTDIKIELTSTSKLSLDTSQIIIVPPPLADWNIRMLHTLFLEAGWITHEEDQSKLILVPWIEAHINGLQLSEKDKIIYTSICFQMQCAKELVAVSKKLASSDFLLVPSVLSSRSVCLPIMNDVLPNAIKRTIANFRNEYIIQHGVNTEDEQPESEVSKAIAKLADLLHGTRKAHFSSRKVGAISQYSCFNKYQLQGLENSQANHFYMKVSHDARVQQRARAVCDFLRASLDEYVTISDAPDGVRSVILSHANNELEWSLHSFCIEQALLQAKIIEPEEKFTYVQCEEGALQRPVKMTQIANAVLSPVIQKDVEEEELDEFAFTSDQEANGISLPLNSFYLQATIGKRQIDFILNKVINVPLVKLFTIQEKTIEIDDIMDTTFVAMWNYYQLLESNGHLDALSGFCEEHKDIILSLDHYECFSTNMPDLFNAWFRDNNDILSNEELDAYQSISIDKECTCTLNISCRMLLEAGLKPAISGIAEIIVGTILSNDHFGLYQVAALLAKKSVDFIDVSFERFLEEKLAKLFQSRQRRPAMLFINEETKHLMRQYLARGSYTQIGMAVLSETLYWHTGPSLIFLSFKSSSTESSHFDYQSS
ncbi:hypothetical protein HMPREF1544_03726 [Mucor circinelloides 1006PhL]|uniref:Uncharacterized protein n=1 Tax=Mucor circinelloides f. circinelloides (strain 1006PhL) TaxID=1220926 RepID=S2KB18_MUCC1|nr:hypothetical protein HMPREF1544_03726 [Mucor circinelloides 1006PhL]